MHEYYYLIDSLNSSAQHYLLQQGRETETIIWKD